MRKALLLFSLLLLSAPAWAQTPARVVVADTLFSGTGAPAVGSLTISTHSTFTSPDGFVLPLGVVAKVQLVAGAFSVSLVPNIGANPTGTYYDVVYVLADQRFSEQWIVPGSGPVNLLAVRTAAPPLPPIMLAINQVNPPAGCLAAGGLVRWTAGGWICIAPGSGTISTLNTLTTAVQTFATGTAGTDFGISSVTATHTFNLPTASATNRGALSSADWSTFNAKQSALLFSLPLLNTTGTVSLNPCVASGASHAAGGVPDPGVTAGSSRFLNENCTFALPPMLSWNTRTGAVLPATADYTAAQVTNAFDTSTTRNANLVYAGPSSGGALAPTFRALVGADLPNPAATTLGGIQSLAAAASRWVNAISTAGVPSTTQPNFTDLLGTATKAQQHAATMFNDQGNTVTTGAQNYAAATSFTLPGSPGSAPTVEGHIGIDTTLHRPVIGLFGAPRVLPFFVSGVPVDTQCVTWTGTSGQVSGAPCAGSSGTILTSLQYALARYTLAGSNTTIGGLAPPTVNGNYRVGYNVTAGGAVDLDWSLAGVPVSAQSASTTLLYSHRANYLPFTGTTSTLTLPAIRTGNMASNFPFVTQNLGSGLLTLTSTTPDTFDGGSAGGSVTVLPNFARFVYQNARPAWQSVYLPTFAAFGGNCGDATHAMDWITCTVIGGQTIGPFVNSGTVGQPAYSAATGTTVSGDPIAFPTLT